MGQVSIAGLRWYPSENPGWRQSQVSVKTENHSRFSADNNQKNLAKESAVTGSWTSVILWEALDSLENTKYYVGRAFCGMQHKTEQEADGREHMAICMCMGPASILNGLIRLWQTTQLLGFVTSQMMRVHIASAEAFWHFASFNWAVIVL